MISTITLNTGAKMPIIGLGTWKSKPNEAGVAVMHALSHGYQHIDCAMIYHNEAEIGKAWEKMFTTGTVKREDIFITSKLWDTDHAPADVSKACKKTLRNLRLDYLDLYLMHWGVATGPLGGLKKISVRETWEAMQDLVHQGLVRAIGVANFTGPMIIDLLTYAKIPPAVNQIELHPYLQQSALIEFCKRNHIVVTAYSPLGTPGNIKDKPNEPILLEDPVISSIAQKYKKTSAQILIRWAIERGTIVIPKSVTPGNIESNCTVFDFSLDQDDLKKIAALERRHRFVNPADWWKISYFD